MGTSVGVGYSLHKNPAESTRSTECQHSQSISRQIKALSGDNKPKFVLQFECMGRGRVLYRDQEKIELLRLLQEENGTDLPWIGFYTYGEIGPISGYTAFTTLRRRCCHLLSKRP